MGASTLHTSTTQFSYECVCMRVEVPGKGQHRAWEGEGLKKVWGGGEEGVKYGAISVSKFNIILTTGDTAF